MNTKIREFESFFVEGNYLVEFSLVFISICLNLGSRFLNEMAFDIFLMALIVCSWNAPIVFSRIKAKKDERDVLHQLFVINILVSISLIPSLYFIFKDY